MNKIIKIAIGIFAFTILLAGAAIAYNILSDRVVPDNGIGLADSTGSISDDNKTDKQKAPDFTMTDSSGNTVKLSDMLGKPIILNFWASWCPPCKDEMPEFDKVFKELGSEIQFMMIDLTDGQRETIETGSKYIKEQGYSFPVFFDTTQDGTMQYGIRSIPTTLFIDKDGYIITGSQGAINEDTLRKGIDMLR